MTLQCKKCGFKSPQGSEFCGSCGEDTEFRVEKMARNAAAEAAAAEALRIREADGLVPVERYFDNGQLQVQGGQKGGKWHGPRESYHENGQLREASTHKAGELEGPYERYYENGQLRQKATYLMGELEGPSEYYYKNGQLWLEGTYRRGLKCGEWIEDKIGFFRVSGVGPGSRQTFRTRHYKPCPPDLEDGN